MIILAIGYSTYSEESSEAQQILNAERLRGINHINNTLANKIMIKREQLNTKLAALDEMNKIYQIESHNDKVSTSTINTVKGFDFLAAYEQLKKTEEDTSSGRYKGKNKTLHRMDEIVLSLENGDKSETLHTEFETLQAQAEDNNYNNLVYHLIKLNYGVAANDANYTVQVMEDLVKTSNYLDANEHVKSLLPINHSQCNKIFELCLKKDHFRGLGVLMNYIEQRKLQILNFDLSKFRPSMEFYQNDRYSVTNILIYLKYYTYYQKCLFNQFGLTPKSLRKLSPSELYEYGLVLFPNVNLADFEFLVKRIGTNRIIEKYTKQDVMKNIIDYFTKYTVPFMDIQQHVHSFVRENDIAEYLANRFNEPFSFKTVMKVAERYGDRTIFHEFILDHIRQYQSANKGALPNSFTKKNIKNYVEALNKKLETEQDYKVSDKTYEILLTLMKSHGMIEEMNQIPSYFKNYYIAEAILNQNSGEDKHFYSNKIKELFATPEDQATPLYSLCLMKALIKEGDTESALRVLENGEKNNTERKRAIDEFYTKIYDYCFDPSNNNERHVAFFPDLLKERETRINQEIEAASKISEYEKNKVTAKYKKSNYERKLPVSYSDFKKKHFQMSKTVNNYTKQMMVMNLVKSAIQDSDYEKIDNLFTYLLITKEEEQLAKALRKDIENYSKYFDNNREPKSLDEAKDPLRVLFKYFRKPTDDINTLVGKYIAIVPKLRDRVNNLKQRKDHLHKALKGAIKEDEALFLADSQISQIQDPELLKEFEKCNFDLRNSKSREAMNKLMAQYSKIMDTMTDKERSYNLPASEIYRARKLYEADTTQNYNEILDQVQAENFRFNNLSNFEKQEKLQLLVDAGDVANEENKEFVDTLASKLRNNELRDFAQIVKRLQNQYQTVLDVKSSFGGKVESQSSFNDALGEHLESYFSHTQGAKKGHSKFINHASGQSVYVDDAKMANDNQYFIKTVAKLAELEIANHSLAQKAAAEKDQLMLNSMMKSREFRKYYYMMRKFYFLKFQKDIDSGAIQVKKDNSIAYNQTATSKL